MKIRFRSPQVQAPSSPLLPVFGGGSGAEEKGLFGTPEETRGSPPIDQTCWCLDTPGPGDGFSVALEKQGQC